MGRAAMANPGDLPPGADRFPRSRPVRIRVIFLRDLALWGDVVGTYLSPI